MILYFSGTGNSRRVAMDLGHILGEEVAFMTRSTVTDSPRVVWVFPIYSWGVPPYVLEAIATATCNPRSVHFMVATCGDDAGLAGRIWRKAIKARGWTDAGAYTVQMPNNYVSMKGFDVDSPALTAEKLAAEPARIEEVARGIQSGAVTDDVVRGSFAWIKTKVIYPWFMRYAMSAKPFNVNSACIGCGKCVKACPLHNVTLRGGHPVWGTDCAGCLGCYHVCPVHAINYGKATLSKGQYYLK